VKNPDTSSERDEFSNSAACLKEGALSLYIVFGKENLLENLMKAERKELVVISGTSSK
jgi:hypothetical protein